MNIPDDIINEINSYEDLVKELSRISHESINEFIRVKEFHNIIERGDIVFKDRFINPSSFALPYEKLYDYNTTELSFIQALKLTDDDLVMRILINVLLGFSQAIVSAISLPMILYMLENNLYHLLFVPKFNYYDESFITSLFPSRYISTNLRGEFEKLVYIKEKSLSILRAYINVVGMEDDMEDVMEEQLYFLNELYESIEDNNYEQFKEVVYSNGVDVFRFYMQFFNLIYINSRMLEIDSNILDSNPDIVDHFLSSNYITDPEFNTSFAIRFAIYLNCYVFSVIKNLPPGAKEAIEYFWEASDFLWFKDFFVKWTEEECSLFTNDTKQDSKRDDNPKRTEKSPKRNLHLGHDVEAIKKLATYLVKGFTNKRGSLPTLVSSNDEKNITINKLIFLFTGNKDYSFEGPYNLTWNAELVYLKLLIKLLHNLNELATSSHAVDDKRIDYISDEYIKCRLTGGVWPKVAEAFENIKSEASVRNADYKKNYKDTEAPINQKRLRDMKVIADLWLKCKNDIDF